ncbi:acyl-CoA thioesterase II [Burkholderia multivorans]|uniref:acyl-CoA thioesterase n=1 Tax=Burkholderia multivorans TaxID=87883 RepID=UPI002018805C|nr:acyl-CoA thioesterase domain-containing protein [Burkholderia multivorans]UQP02851.1 acyl-CoA thioesterase II [Burkholderia multivorans]
MDQLPQDLIDLLNLEQVNADVFIGKSKGVGTTNLYGGQMLAQALAAACRTVPADRSAHSLHSYFLLPGIHEDVRYKVTRVRDGRSFSMRRVVGEQGGKDIFELTVSFQTAGAGVEHQFEMPQVPPPESLESEAAFMERMVPEHFRGRHIVPIGIEYRRVQPFDFSEPKAYAGTNFTWLRATPLLPDDPHLHRAVLTYASDHGLLITPMIQHGLSFVLGQVILGSLDHAMWFHRDFRADDWLLYCTDAPSAANARGFSRGSFYTRDGVLVASAAQEGFMRVPALSAGRQNA